MVVDGYMKALEKSQQVLDDDRREGGPILEDRPAQGSHDEHDDQAGLRRRPASRAARGRRGDSGGRKTGRRSKTKVDIDNVKVEKKAGGSLVDTKLISGIALDKEVVHSAMPKRIESAKIALINSPLEIEKTEFSAEIRINDPDQMQKFLEEENNILKGMVEKIEQSGANVVVCQKGIDDVAQHYLARAGILAVRRVKESDMTKLAKATGATHSHEPRRPHLEGPRARRSSQRRGRSRKTSGSSSRVQEPEGSDHTGQGRLAESGRRGRTGATRCADGHEGRCRESH